MSKVTGRTRSRHRHSTAEDEIIARARAAGKSYDDLSKEEHRALRVVKARQELERWEREGDPTPETSDGIDIMLRDSFARTERRLALGVPDAVPVGDIIRKAKLEEEEARYQREKVSPLRAKALALTAKLQTILLKLVEVEGNSPERLRSHFYEQLARFGGPLIADGPGPAKDDAPTALPVVDEEAQRRARQGKLMLLLDLCTPARMATFLVYLNANLDSPSSRGAGRRGRPRNLAVQRVQEALQAAGVSYRTQALVLQSEGLERFDEVEDVRERVRARRRRGGRKESAKQSLSSTGRK
jgi:hypothetical protein